MSVAQFVLLVIGAAGSWTRQLGKSGNDYAYVVKAKWVVLLVGSAVAPQVASSVKPCKG